MNWLSSLALTARRATIVLALVVPVLSLIAPARAAAPACASVFNQPTAAQAAMARRIGQFTWSGFTPSIETFLARTFIQVHLLLLPGFEAPPGLRIELREGTLNDMNYNPFTNTLTLTKGGLKATGSSEAVMGVIIHEYLHAVFLHALRKDFPEIGPWLDVSRKMVAEFPERPWKEMVVFTAGLPQANPLFTSFLRVHDMTRAWQEVFSDLGAASYFGNPRLLRALNDPKTMTAETGSREFTGKAFDAKWTLEKIHDQLWPVRSFLWDRYFSRVKNLPHRPAMMRKVYEVLVALIRDRKPGDPLPTPEKLNLALLNLLQAALKDFE